jgi:hypothetical protein
MEVYLSLFVFVSPLLPDKTVVSLHLRARSCPRRMLPDTSFHNTYKSERLWYQLHHKSRALEHYQGTCALLLPAVANSIDRGRLSILWDEDQEQYKRLLCAVETCSQRSTLEHYIVIDSVDINCLNDTTRTIRKEQRSDNKISTLNHYKERIKENAVLIFIYLF